jgi:hypothetical protein
MVGAFPVVLNDILIKKGQNDSDSQKKLISFKKVKKVDLKK